MLGGESDKAVEVGSVESAVVAEDMDEMLELRWSGGVAAGR